MSDIQLPESMEKELEIAIIRAFGSAIIEFEAVLFQKVLLHSAQMLITEDIFKAKINEMADRGFVAPLEFHGRPCWRKLATEEDLEVEEPLTPEEIRSILEQGQKDIPVVERTPRSPSDRLVTEARNIAQDVLHLVRARMLDDEENKDRARREIIQHLQEMRKTLTDSEQEFVEYVRENLPEISGRLELILKAKGEDLMLPALRMIEAGLRDEF
ncbi:MAG: hypothetical protein JSW61_12500 [Candidatus Thorarchaeota archaeon]|nr:MAG: hypothetical protein JSW61_12500 [Candidatus Thorarchaeota archaeon]